MTGNETSVSRTASMKKIRAQAHPHCLVCSSTNPLGLDVEFTQLEDGTVQGTFCGGENFQGYSGLVHGGVIATLLDGAMTNCLFASGRTAVTAELRIRYREPVLSEASMTIRAWIENSFSRLHLLRAELTQEARVKAIATGKFMDKAE